MDKRIYWAVLGIAIVAMAGVSYYLNVEGFKFTDIHISLSNGELMFAEVPVHSGKNNANTGIHIDMDNTELNIYIKNGAGIVERYNDDIYSGRDTYDYAGDTLRIAIVNSTLSVAFVSDGHEKTVFTRNATECDVYIPGGYAYATGDVDSEQKVRSDFDRKLKETEERRMYIFLPIVIAFMVGVTGYEIWKKKKGDKE